MHVTVVDVHVKPEHVADFIEATRVNHLASVREPGNLRFDVLQSPQEPGRFLLYEAYASAEAAAAHRQTPHYVRWRDAVMDWMAAPRVGAPYLGLFPQPDGSE
ncbi:MAG: antibiotic biosynthesis monooxygenase [Gammaproteobacteria bacterium]|nr:antibiotic biosynthesis monooxygenase [Gammaproteobacteria bacterium]